MKKYLAFIAAAVMLTSALSGCGSSDSSAASSDTSGEPTSSSSDGASSEGDSSSEWVNPFESDEKLYESPYNTPMEMRDISAWELVKEMKTGWNLGNTLDATGNPTLAAEFAWQKDITTKGLFDKLSSEGFNVARIPVSWGEHMDENYTVDPAWMARVHEIVDYAIDNDMFVILNTHHEEWYYPDAENKEQDIEQLKALWKQIAEEFINYDEHLIFEGLNEPRLRGTSYEWNGGTKEAREIVVEYEKAFYETVRATGGNNEKRALMVSGYAASSDKRCLKAVYLPENDNHIIVSVHGYLPYSMALDTHGTDQFTEQNYGEIDNLFKTLYELFLSNEIPVIIGEYGCLNKENIDERVECVTYYLNAAKQLGVPCVWWDNNYFAGENEDFGILKRQDPYDWYYPEIAEAIKTAVYGEEGAGSSSGEESSEAAE